MSISEQKMQIMNILDIPSCVLGHLFSFLNGESLLGFRKTNNHKLIELTNTQIFCLRFVGNHNSVLPAWQSLHRFSKLTIFEFVHAKHTIMFGKWQPMSRCLFYLEDLVHLPPTLRSIKLHAPDQYVHRPVVLNRVKPIELDDVKISMEALNHQKN